MALRPRIDKQKLMAIHRHWIWADALRLRYYDALSKEPTPREEDLAMWFVRPVGMYMCLWYGLLFSICEAFRENDIVPAESEPEFSQIYDSLRLFRNAVFHVQTEYFSDKLFEIMKHKRSPAQILKVHQVLGQWVLDALKSSHEH